MRDLAVNKSPAAQPDACPAFLNPTMSGRINSMRAGLHPGPRVVPADLVLAGAALIGAGYGWVAMKTGSVAPVLGAHAITDASGVRVAKELWLGRPVRGPGLLQVSR